MKIKYMASFDKDFKLLGKRIAEYRKKAGLTQVQLAMKLEITREHLSHVEIGIKHPSVELLFLIAKTLNIKAKILFDFE